mgnify:FL=1
MQRRILDRGIHAQRSSGSNLTSLTDSLESLEQLSLQPRHLGSSMPDMFRDPSKVRFIFDEAAIQHDDNVAAANTMTTTAFTTTTTTTTMTSRSTAPAEIFTPERVEYMLSRQSRADTELEQRSDLCRSMPDSLPSATREHVHNMIQFYIDQLREMDCEDAMNSSLEVEWRFILIEQTLGVCMSSSSSSTLDFDQSMAHVCVWLSRP